ncbi:MAG: glycosyltransferase family 8 protein [Rickettsiales bacterium]|nr:MAG: glycosyltransferase family 8 protein [Rickettsiales bacterium]
MISDRIITIVVASDNQYAVLTAALLKSIEINHKTPEHINFIIIDDGISNSNKKKLEQSINNSIITLKWIKADNLIPANIKIPADQSTLPYTTYLRLFTPYAVDQECKKLIYMDVDMLMFDDVSNLYNIDLGNKIIGAVQDYQFVVSSPTAIKNYQALGMLPDAMYFNGGMLLIDTQKWREADISKKVIDCMNENLEHVLYADQYGLNVVLHKNWKQIDLLWNCSDYFEEPSNPSLVHFLNIKPIFKSCPSLQRNKDEFFRVLSLTAFKNFKPKSDYHRLFKKGFTKAKKVVHNLISSK